MLRGAAATDPALVVSGPVVVDSRDDVTGGLFVALPGENVDGHDYAAVAVAGGAALGDDDVERQQRLETAAQSVALDQTDRDDRPVEPGHVAVKDLDAGAPVTHQ